MTAIRTTLPSCWHGFTSLVNGGQPGNNQERQTAGSRRVVMYQCRACDEIYEDEDEAEECCAIVAVESIAKCPVCNQQYNDDYRSAADCCLWKDLDAHTRWKIADAVEDGSTWADEIELLKKGCDL